MTELYDVDSQRIQQTLIDEVNGRIHTATALLLMTQMEGWTILLNTFENMKQDQLDELSAQSVGNEKAVLAAHAVWSATVHTLDQIVSAVRSAIQDGESAKHTLSQLTHTPIDQENDW